MLCSLRSRTVRSIKSNFSRLYIGNLKCQLGCNVEETQEHCLICPVIPRNQSRTSNICYSDIFGDIVRQIAVTKEFHIVLQEREQLLQDKDSDSLPVAKTGPIM